jgi:hypothetical protein
MKRTTTIPSQLSESLHQRLNAYTLAASAAGVGVLALAQPAEAKIIYTPTHQVIKPNSMYNVLDLNKDGITDFFFEDKFHGSFYCASLYFFGRTGAENWVSDGDVLALRKGTKIGANRPWSGTSGGIAHMAEDRFLTGGTFSSRGNWASVTNRYLGLRISVNHERHYGWARMTVKIDSKTCEITAVLTGYAYETIPNKKIIAGKTHGRDEATLGHLATGASAIPAWRVKPAAATTH